MGSSRNVYVVGVDGGSSKTEFALADAGGTLIDSFIVPGGANPHYRLFAEIQEMLERGLKRITAAAAGKKIGFFYFGISGCHGGGSNAQQIESCIAAHCSRYLVTGDLDSSFRSMTGQPCGILAIAGAGGAIRAYAKDGSAPYASSMSFGGRDFGSLVCSHLAHGGIPPNSAVYTIVEKHVGGVKAFLAALTGRAAIDDPRIPALAQALVLAGAEQPQVALELHPLAVTCASRWAQVICKYGLRSGFEEHEELTVVLSGGLWQWQAMREMMIKDVAACFPAVQVLYDPETRPVIGCVRLACAALEKTDQSE